MSRHTPTDDKRPSSPAQSTGRTPACRKEHFPLTGLEDSTAPPAPDSAAPRLLVISPVRNEAAYLQHTIDSMVAQTCRPLVWIIVDDGSTDDTAAIADRAAAGNDWIQVVKRADRGARKVGGGVVDAFYDGLAEIDLGEFDFLCKLDGDLKFRPTYFERLFERFRDDPSLGTASGKSWIHMGNRMVAERTSDEFSQGQSKLYRVSCFQDIGGFVREVMWDGIDCHRCRMKGWKACSFGDEELRFIHLRPMGSSVKNIFTGRLRWGRGQFFMGTHWLYILAIAGYRMLERPWCVGGMLILIGYLSAALRRLPRYEDLEFRRHLRTWQLRRLRGLFGGSFGY